MLTQEQMRESTERIARNETRVQLTDHWLQHPDVQSRIAEAGLDHRAARKAIQDKLRDADPNGRMPDYLRPVYNDSRQAFIAELADKHRNLLAERENTFATAKALLAEFRESLTPHVQGYFHGDVEKIGSPGDASQAITLIMNLLKGELGLQQEYAEFYKDLKADVEDQD